MTRERFWRDFWIAASIVGPSTLLGLLVFAGGRGYDTFSYWRVPHLGTTLYAATAYAAGPPGVFRYSPAFAQIVSLAWWLPWTAFSTGWILLNFSAYLAMVPRRWWLAGLAFMPVAFELFDGNVHLLIGVALVASFRWPATWSFLLLTKLTPGIGLIWYVARREWRNLAIALGATAGIILTSIVIGGVGLWVEWAQSLAGSSPASWTALAWCPFPVRLAAAALLTTWGARRDARWVLPMAAVLSLASPWDTSFAILVACVPLARNSKLVLRAMPPAASVKSSPAIRTSITS